MPPPPVDPSAVAAVAAATRPFRQRIVHRQILAAHGSLWAPTRRPSRYSAGIPALYTALDLDVALAERITAVIDPSASLSARRRRRSLEQSI